MCCDNLDARNVVYSKEVPLAQAQSINGLRAVFGEVNRCFTLTMYASRMLDLCSGRAASSHSRSTLLSAVVDIADLTVVLCLWRTECCPDGYLIVG